MGNSYPSLGVGLSELTLGLAYRVVIFCNANCTGCAGARVTGDKISETGNQILGGTCTMKWWKFHLMVLTGVEWPFSKPRLLLQIRLRLAWPRGCFDNDRALCTCSSERTAPEAEAVDSKGPLYLFPVKLTFTVIMMCSIFLCWSV